MFGNDVESYGQREARLRTEREERLRQFIIEQRPISAIAKLESLDLPYARVLVRRMVKDEGLEYNPPKITRQGKEPIVGLTEDTRKVRAKLGDYLAALGRDHRSIALNIGILFRSQQYARDRPFNYDWTLSNIERLARASDIPFKRLMLEALLTSDEMEKVKRCGII